MNGVLSCNVWMQGSLGTVTPDGDVIEPVGATVKIDCTLSENASDISPGDSRQLIWKKNSEIIPDKYVRVVDNYTAQLSMPNVTMDDSGSYKCLFNTSSELKIVCYNLVQIGYSPLNVTDFSCMSPNWQNLVCTFTSPNNTIRPKYELEYMRASEARGNCTLKRNRTRYTCIITNESTPLYTPAAPRYTFVLKASNKLGSSKFRFTVDHFSRVVPNPPVNLMVTTLNSTVINISWSRPKELKFFPVGLTCHLHYLSQWDKPDLWNTVTGINNNSVILNVIPFTEYHIKVKCRSATASDDDGLWSHEVSIPYTTISDIPGQPPLLVPGSFQDKPSLDSRTISIFWQTIPPYERKGSDFTYKAIGSLLSKSGVKRTISPQETKENYAVFDDLDQETEYAFEIYSVNKQGRSVDSSYLMLEKQSKISARPEAFTAIYFDHGVYELSWRESPNMKDVLNYTLFWCNNIKPHPFRCSGNLSWIHVSQGTRAYNITLQDEKVNYHFAIAANTNNSTSGMVWATCIVPYNGTLNKMKKITLIATSKSSIRVSWRLDCSERIGIVTGFNIYYCPVSVNDTASPCIGSEKNKFVNGSHEEKSVIENLMPFTYYKVVVAAVTRAGEGEHSNGKIVRTAESAPTIGATNITYGSRTESSITLQWDAPDPPFGNIVKYIIYGGPKIESLSVSPNQTHFQFTLTNLTGFTDYKIQLMACIIDNSCSEKTESFLARTDIGFPDVMGRPQIVDVNSTHIILSFDDPVRPNGPIDYRNLLVTWDVKGTNHSKQETNITQKEIVFETRCGDPDVESATLHFSSQAVNVWQGNVYKGPYGDAASYHCVTYNQAYVVLIATLSTVGIASVIGLIFYGYLRFKRHCEHIILETTIKVPRGFETENFKPDFHLNQPIQHAKTKNGKDFLNKLNKLQNESSRSRNTSGETRISTSSIDELLQRNGDINGERNGDNNSALGSVSSTQTTRSNLSSDLSNSDANSLPPTTPDMVFLDNPMQPMKSVPEVDGTDVESPKHALTEDEPPASYSKFAQYLGGPVPSTVNGYIQTLPVSTSEHSAYVAPNPPNNSSYSQVGLAAGSNYTNYPNGEANDNTAALQTAPTEQYSQVGLANVAAPRNNNQFGYSAVGLAKDAAPSHNNTHPGYVSADMANDLCCDIPSKTSDKCSNANNPSDNSQKLDQATNAYVPMRPHSENPSPMYSRVSFQHPSGSGYVPPSKMEMSMDQPSVKSISEPVSNGFENVPLVCNKDIMDTSSPTCTNKPSTPKKNGYVSLDMMEDKAGCLNSYPSPNEIMKSSHLSDESQESHGPYSRVVSMTFDDADSGSMAEDRSLK